MLPSIPVLPVIPSDLDFSTGRLQASLKGNHSLAVEDVSPVDSIADGTKPLFRFGFTLPFQLACFNGTKFFVLRKKKRLVVRVQQGLQNVLTCIRQ